jgi:hypothetical protein
VTNLLLLLVLLWWGVGGGCRSGGVALQGLL